VCVCVCRYLCIFIEFQQVQVPYFIVLVSFLEILGEREAFEPKVPLDKMIIFPLPKFSNAFWKQLHQVKIYDTLTFVDKAPQYYLPVPPNKRPPTRRQLFPDIPPPQLTTFHISKRCYIYVHHDWCIPPGTQVEVPVQISRPTWRTDPDSWVTDPIELANGILTARSLFQAGALHTFIPVMNLTCQPYELHQDQLVGEASRVEVCGPNTPTSKIGVESVSGSKQELAARQIIESPSFTSTSSSSDMDHIQCLIDG